MKRTISILLAAVCISLLMSVTTSVSAATLTETEPNDTKETANLIKSGDYMNGTKRDANDLDFYKFETLTDGKAVIGIKNVPGSRWWMEVYDAYGNMLYNGSADSSDNATGYTEKTLGLKKGSYTIAIRPSGDSNVTNYTIRYAFENALNYEAESNDTFDTANPIKTDATYQGSIHTWYDSGDMYKVHLDKNGELKIDLEYYTEFDWEFSLYDAEGNYLDGLTTDYLDTKTEKNTLGFNTRLKKGTYFIKVDTWDFWGYTYKLSTTFKPSEFFEKEPNNTPEAANELPLNQTMRGQFFIENDPADYFKFTVEKAGKYRLTQKQHYNAEWDLFLYDANHNRIGWKQTTSAIGYQAISYVDLEQYLQPGTYYAAVGPAYAGITWIDYQLTLTSVANPPFKDVPIGHPYFNEIHLMKSKEIILGHTDGSYKPADSLLRHHAALIIERSGVDLTPIRPALDFSDVPKSHPSYSSIQKLYRAGIIDGSNGKFDPNGTLTREQMAKILVNSFKLQKKPGTVLSFSDVPASRWSYSYVNILASNGITIGYNGKFMPTDKLTREHYAVFLSRVWVNK